ncbi:MAG TPA: DinB family protein [Candidatus Baltobacteraceae bacterium]|nr:DinB family protein [Candidatus Baltobacteraceae bacterium]
MTPAERERAITSLRDSRDRLFATAEKLSPLQLAYKPAPDRWSVAECIEHIIVVENSVFGLIQKAIEQPPEAAKSGSEDDAIVATVVDRTQRAKGPEALMPASRWSQDGLLPEFRQVRGRSLDFAGSTSADLRALVVPHRRFGHLDCYQWLLLIAAHGERHRAQAEEVIASAEFPRAASAS